MQKDFTIVFCTYFKSLEKFRYSCETYGEYTAFCLGSSSFSYKIGTSPEKVLHAGEMVVCPPNQPFQRKIISAADLLMFKFSPASPAFAAAGQPLRPERTRLVYDLEKLETCRFCTDPEGHPSYAHFCRDILYSVPKCDEDNSAFSDIARLLREEFESKISISSLAAEKGYSSAQFINIFKKSYGCSPKQYLMNVRTNRAKELLATTQRPVKEIAAMCGFGDELYFIKFFKKSVGMPPAQFRKYITKIAP